MESRKKEKKKKVGPIRYQRLEQSMTGYCDNYCKNTKPSLSRPTCRPHIKAVIRMPLSRWPDFAGWYQIITAKQ